MTVPLPEVTWRDWPAQQQRGRAILVGVMIVATSVGVAILDPMIAAVGSVALVAAVSEVLLPTTYTLSSDGVSVNNVLRKRQHPWRHFRGWRTTPGRIVLLGEGPAGIIRRRRTVLLRCPDN
ncbi:MAG: hypothetical protein ACI8RZ_002210, partial [Myxococcota bacterium]